ncbi:MAG: glycosyltransferase family 39 protein [bacterium]|nr:glycosyltransferase family 39 protein [bacterium]
MKLKLAIFSFVFILLSLAQINKITTREFVLDEYIWIPAGITFVDKLSHGEFEKTNLSTRPGVTVEIVTGTTTTLVRRLNNQKDLFTTQISENEIFVNRVVIGLILALLASLSFFPLSILLGQRNAALGTLLLGLNPLLIRLQAAWTDLFLALFLVLSLFCYLVFWEKKNKSFLFLSALAFGLALASKAFAIILIPSLALSSIWFNFNKENVKNALRSVFVVFAGGLAIVYLIYPFLWVKPFGLFFRYPELTNNFSTSVTDQYFGSFSVFFYPYNLFLYDFFLAVLVSLLLLPTILHLVRKRSWPNIIQFPVLFFLLNLVALLIVSQAKYLTHNTGQNIAGYRYFAPAVFSLILFLVASSAFVAEKVNFWGRKSSVPKIFPFLVLGYYLFEFFFWR